MKLVRCRDHGFDCDFEAESESEDEVLKQAAEHLQAEHDLEVTSELAEKVQAGIHELPESKGHRT